MISEDGKSCSWKLDQYNIFTIEDGLLKGVIGDFRCGGDITPYNIDEIKKWDFENPDSGNSIFIYVFNKKDVELVKQDMLNYIDEIKKI